MPENFLVSVSNASARKVSTSETSEPVNKISTEATPERTSERESLRILVIGSRQGVLGTIQTLHRLRFAEVHEWSPLLPSANPGEVMSILTRYSIMT